jgi:hypothetical protein
MTPEDEKKKDEVEKFFQEAFCAEKATILLGVDNDNYEIRSIVEIETKDRGTIHIATINKVK